ncbi:hypothetical protein MRX96_048287 [Rhipicephalus microplus]
MRNKHVSHTFVASPVGFRTVLSPFLTSSPTHPCSRTFSLSSRVDQSAAVGGCDRDQASGSDRERVAPFEQLAFKDTANGRQPPRVLAMTAPRLEAAIVRCSSSTECCQEFPAADPDRSGWNPTLQVPDSASVFDLKIPPTRPSSGDTALALVV